MHYLHASAVTNRFHNVMQSAVFLSFFLFTTTLIWGQAPENRKDDVATVPPNVVLIMADDMGYECVEANGGTAYPTPVLNKLAKTGMRFTNCFSTPICTPTRVQIMTGKYNFRNYSHFGYLHPSSTTFGHTLKRAGYSTCIAGKWQLNGLYHELPGYQNAMRPKSLGFDETCLWQVTKHKKFGERFADPLIETNGVLLEKQTGKYGPDIFSDFVCKFIENHNSKPFFCYYPMVLVHNPFVPTPDSPEWKTDKRTKNDKRFFADMVTYADKIVGKILKTIDRAGVAENTIVIFIGDNGTNRGISTPTKNGPVQGGKGLTIETGIHVPMFAYWKGTTPVGKTCDDLIDFTDIMPTLLAATGVETEGVFDGVSFLPQLNGKPGTPRESIFCHYDPRWGPMKDTPTRFARDKRFKLYHDGRFFDVSKDPLEKNALANVSEQVAAARTKLQAKLDSMPAWDPQPVSSNK